MFIVIGRLTSCDAGGEPIELLALHSRRRQGLNILNELLGLDIGHAVHTGDTITDGQDAACLGEVGWGICQLNACGEAG